MADPMSVHYRLTHDPLDPIGSQHPKLLESERD